MLFSISFLGFLDEAISEKYSKSVTFVLENRLLYCLLHAIGVLESCFNTECYIKKKISYKFIRNYIVVCKYQNEFILRFICYFCNVFMRFFNNIQLNR